MGEKARMGSVVGLYYRGGVKGEEPVDERVEGEPLVVMIGDMKLPRGIEQALVGMEAGERSAWTCRPNWATASTRRRWRSGTPSPCWTTAYSLKVGDVMFHRNPSDGSRQPAFVTDEAPDNVRLDFNHPFAGKTLDYWVKLVEVR